MQFYREYLAPADAASGALPDGAHYHIWTPESIARLWSIWSNNPLLRSQFYPAHYYEALVAEARPHFGEIAQVVDIGCGSGTVLGVLAANGIGRRFVGVDLSEESLAKLRTTFPDADRFTFQVGSIARTGLDAASADLVICTETLEHLFPADFAEGLAEIARILKPGGTLLATVPLEERPNFVACPECRAIFAPYQHMLFGFTIAQLAESLARHGVTIVRVIQPIDVGVPRRAWKRFVKDRILRTMFPGLARRLFRVAGVSGFVARKRLAAA